MPSELNPVSLITPPSPFLLDQRVFMSLGILRVAAVLEQAGQPVEHLDLSGVDNYLEAVCHHAHASRATVFGVTATTPQMPAAVKIARTLRTCRPDCRILLGGPHPTLVNAAKKREERSGVLGGRAARAFGALLDGFDVVVAGDGEEAIFLALQPDAPPLIDADDPRSPLFLTNARLDELPWPARHLVDVGSYHYTIDGVPALSLICQLGCPFSCGFCGGRDSAMLRRVRTRSTANVVAEIVHLYEAHGVSGMMMYDDELNVSPRMVEMMDALAAEQERLGARFALRGFIKSQLFTDRQAEAMARAGFKWILVGFESGSPRMLENMNKQATRAQNTRCMEIARRHGLRVKALMSIGHPGESRHTVGETEDWLVEQGIDDFDVAIITCYPGSAYYDRAEPHPDRPGVWTYTVPKTGDRLHAVDVDFSQTADYYKGAPGDYRAYVFTDHLSAEDLVALRDRMEADVRHELGIPFNPSAAAVRYEHSMGQGGLPASILRTTL